MTNPPNGVRLHERFIKQHGEKTVEFVCIDSMHVVGPASPFLDYTQEQVHKGRGGLFYFSDSAFLLWRLQCRLLLYCQP